MLIVRYACAWPLVNVAIAAIATVTALRVLSILFIFIVLFIFPFTYIVVISRLPAGSDAASCMLLIRQREGRIGSDFAGNNALSCPGVAKLEAGLGHAASIVRLHQELPLRAWKRAVRPQHVRNAGHIQSHPHAFGSAHFVHRLQ